MNTMSSDDWLQPRGIHGWLILVALGLVVAPVRILLQMAPIYGPVFADGTWEALTDPASEVYHWAWGPLIVGEIFANVIQIVGCVVLLVLMFRQSRHFPRWFIILTSFALAAGLVDALAVKALMPEEPLFDRATAVEVGRSVVGAAIWIPYMLLSERVKNTFVK